MHNLLLDLDNRQSYSKFSKIIRKTNFLQWAGLHHFIPPHLKGTQCINKSLFVTYMYLNSFVTENNVFDVMENQKIIIHLLERLRTAAQYSPQIAKKFQLLL